MSSYHFQDDLAVGGVVMDECPSNIEDVDNEEEVRKIFQFTSFFTRAVVYGLCKKKIQKIQNLFPTKKTIYIIKFTNNN